MTKNQIQQLIKDNEQKIWELQIENKTLKKILSAQTKVKNQFTPLKNNVEKITKMS